MTTTEAPLELTFDPGSITIGDLEAIEEATGESSADFMKRIQKNAGKKGWMPGAKDMKALVLIALRRTNPDATLAEASAVRVSAIKSTPRGAEVAADADPQ